MFDHFKDLNRLLADDRLSTADLAVAVVLLAHRNNETGALALNQERIAKEAKCSDRTARRSLVELQRLGLIRVEKTGRTARYEFMQEGLFDNEHRTQCPLRPDVDTGIHVLRGHNVRSERTDSPLRPDTQSGRIYNREDNNISNRSSENSPTVVNDAAVALARKLHLRGIACNPGMPQLAELAGFGWSEDRIDSLLDHAQTQFGKNNPGKVSVNYLMAIARGWNRTGQAEPRQQRKPQAPRYDMSGYARWIEEQQREVN